MSTGPSVPVLDHGFIRVIETYGKGDAGKPEAGIIEAARQSTQGSFRGWESDRKLLKYLYDHKHATPFEFAGAVIEVRAPLFVFREWHRHRTQGYNEMSGRYRPLPPLCYVPTLGRLMDGARATENRQAGPARKAEPLTLCAAKAWRQEQLAHHLAWQQSYQEALAKGVPKELARIGMPLGHYSQMRAVTGLRNWLGFLTLRMDPQAQWEIRQYANALHGLLAEEFPETLALFGVPE